MRLGLGLPTTIPDVPGDLIISWAQRADAADFSSLGMIDRLVYTNYEPLITLATVAGATQRIQLLTMVLIAPLRNPSILAKQAATLDVLSNGRLTLGLGLGAREDDYLAAAARFTQRGRQLEAHLMLMKQIWEGQATDGSLRPIGPKPLQPGGPEVLLGAYTPAGIQRVGQWANGFIFGGATDPRMRPQIIELVNTAWQAAGRAGKPRFVASLAYALGPDALDRARPYVMDYYAYLGARAAQVAQGIMHTAEQIKGAIQMYADLGVDEVILFPSIPDIEQFDRIVEIVK